MPATMGRPGMTPSGSRCSHPASWVLFPGCLGVRETPGALRLPARAELSQSLSQARERAVPSSQHRSPHPPDTPPGGGQLLTSGGAALSGGGAAACRGSCDCGGTGEGLVLCGGCPGSVPLSLAPLHPEHPTATHPRPSLNPGQHLEIPEKMGLGPGKAEPPAPTR